MKEHFAQPKPLAAQLPTLLVVEDNAELRDYIRQSLAARYRVVTAADGREGFDLAQKESPDVVLTDVMMPVMDGYELCRRLKADVGTSHVPVILLTAKDLMDDKAEGYAAGADSYLTKPFSARLLTSRIDNLLRVRRQLAEVVAQRMATPPAEAASKADADNTASQAGAAGAATAVSEENAATDQPAAPALSPVDQKFLTKLDTFVLTHLEQEKLDVGYIASEMCMSHSTLYRKVKALIGISVNEYVRRTRLRRAAELLTQGDCTISEVADRTGFSTPSYFRQCFKDAYGITPSDYAAGKRK